MEHSQHSVTNWQLARQLWQHTWPMAMGVMSLLGFFLVDSIFVAHLGTIPLAALSFTFPLGFLMVGVQVGIGIATAALISRAIGAGNTEQANRLGALVLIGGAVVLGVLLLLLWFLQDAAFSLMGASEEIRQVIRPFWLIQECAMWVGAMVYLVYSLFRAHGNTRFPGLMMVATSVTNLLLDPLFIFGVGDWQGLGLEGAAWASLLSFSLGAVVVTFALRGKGWVQREGLRAELRASLWPFGQICGPAMVSQLMPPLAAMLATSFVARSGEQAVAAWGLASRLESFSLVLVLGMTMALPPWLGRCYGANDWHTIRRLMMVAALMVGGWQLVLGLVMSLLAAPLSSALVATSDVQAYLVQLVRWLPPSYGFLAICMLVVSASNALGWPMRAMFISFLRLFVCYLPMLWIGLILAGFSGLALGAALGNGIAGIVAWYAYQQALNTVRAPAASS